MVATITISAVNAVQGFVQAPVALTSTAASIAWNLNTAQNATHVMTENTTLANPTNQVAGMTYYFRVTQHASSAKTLAFGSAYEDSTDMPIISTTLSAVDIFVFRSDGTTMSLIDYAANVGA